MSLTYEHFVYAKKTNELAGIYQKAGYITQCYVDDHLVMVYADFNEDTHLEDCEKVEKIAKENGATYDGGGCYVGPLK